MADDQIDETTDTTSKPEPGEHRVKEDVRTAVAKVVGIATEAGSMLAGHSGEMVSAEGKVAEADAEKFMDSIDGEG